MSDIHGVKTEGTTKDFCEYIRSQLRADESLRKRVIEEQIHTRHWQQAFDAVSLYLLAYYGHKCEDFEQTCIVCQKYALLEMLMDDERDMSPST